MALTKTIDGISYELTGNKQINGKHATVKVAEKLSTPQLLWILTRRHKTGLLAASNVILALNWLVPAWPELIRSLFN